MIYHKRNHYGVPIKGWSGAFSSELAFVIVNCMALFVEELGYGQGCSFMDCCREFFCNLVIISPTGELTDHCRVLWCSGLRPWPTMEDHESIRLLPGFALSTVSFVWSLVQPWLPVISKDQSGYALGMTGNVAGTFVDGVLIENHCWKSGMRTSFFCYFFISMSLLTFSIEKTIEHSKEQNPVSSRSHVHLQRWFS